MILAIALAVPPAAANPTQIRENLQQLYYFGENPRLAAFVESTNLAISACREGGQVANNAIVNLERQIAATTSSLQADGPTVNFDMLLEAVKALGLVRYACGV